MKKKVIFFGTLPIAAIAVTLMFANPQGIEGKYQPKDSEEMLKNGMAGALEEYYDLRGDFTKEEYQIALKNAEAMPSDRAAISWIDEGPDNVGGRTRAMCVDTRNVNHVYAGGVSGGLFESYNRANTWHKVDEFSDNLGIASIIQTADGSFYVATGHPREGSGGSQALGDGYNGNGVYQLDCDSDGSNTVVSNLSGTTSYSWIAALKADTLTGDTFYMATSGGLRKYSAGTITTLSTTTSGDCQSLAVSPNGSLIVCKMSGSGGKTNVSTNGGSTWSNVTGGSSTQIPNASRMEYAISWDLGTGGFHNIYAVGSDGSGALDGVWRSIDGGTTWEEIAPENDGTPGSFAPFDLGIQFQGWWDQHIATVRGNPEKCIIGGIDCYSWATGENWVQISQAYGGAPIGTTYMHSDQHGMIQDQWGRMYFFNDGGIYFSDDLGGSFNPANRGYNVCTSYSVGFSAHGDVATGMQDNNSTINYHNNSTWKEHVDVIGGDGTTSHISFINRDINFAASQNGNSTRSSDRGDNSFSFVPSDWGCTPGTDCGPFATTTMLWEDPDDQNSLDSISFIPPGGYLAGEIVDVPSLTSQTTISYVTPTDIVYDDTVNFDPGATQQDTLVTSVAPSTVYNLLVTAYTFVSGGPGVSAGDSLYFVDLDTTIEVLSYTTIDHYYGTNALRPGVTVDMGVETQIYGVAWDTLMVQDPYQSWFAIVGNGEVWMTRNALRFSASSDEWFKVATSVGNVKTLQFSKDGNHLFMGNTAGQVYRLTGFNTVYSPLKVDDPLTGELADTLIDVDAGSYATTLTQLNGGSGVGGTVTGIAVGAIGDPDHVVITIGGFSGTNKVKECTDGTTAGTFTTISGDFPNGVPAYSCIIDRDNPNLILVGTEFGVYQTTNGGTNWEDVSGDFGKVPVFDMGQNWRTWDEGDFKPGAIYIACHGRGIWSSDEYLNIPTEQDGTDIDKFIPNISVYPNPVNTQGTIAFDLESNSSVNVQIFNLSGQIVEEISVNNMAEGNNNITFSAEDLPRGTYIIRLVAGDLVETTKFIKH